MSRNIPMRHLPGYPHLILTLAQIIFTAISVAQTLDTYPNFNTAGVIVTNAGTATSARLQYRRAGESIYREGHPLSRVIDLGNVGLASSLFWLSPGTTYEVRVILPGSQTLTGSLTTRAESTAIPPTPTRILHASPVGGGTCNSAGSPCTLTTAIGQANDANSGVVEIRLQGGTYTVGDLWLDSPVPVILRATSGQTPVLDGSQPITGSWSGPVSGVYSRAIPDLTPESLVLADGQRLFPYASLTDLRNLRWGLSGFYTDGNQLHVRLVSGANPSTRAMRYSVYGNGLEVNQDNAFIIGLTFRYYGKGARARALLLRPGADNTVVSDNRFIVNDIGVGIRANSNRNVIQRNTFTDTVYPGADPDSRIWDAIKDGSTPNEWEGGGLFFSSVSETDPTARARGTVIRHNTFSGFFDGMNVCPYAVGTETASPVPTNETDLHHNTFFNMADDAASFDGHCSNVRAWGNVFHDVLVGISLAPVANGPVYALGNLIRDPQPRIIQGSPGTGTAFKFIVTDDRRSGDMHLYHNTVDARHACDGSAQPCASGFVITSSGHRPKWTRLTTRNNIFLAGGDGHALFHESPSVVDRPLDLDCDVLWNNNAGELANWASTDWTLERLRANTGEEPRGRNVDPMLVGDARTPPADSTLRDSACTITGVNDVWPGELPDFGYAELVPPIFRDGFE